MRYSGDAGLLNFIRILQSEVDRKQIQSVPKAVAYYSEAIRRMVFGPVNSISRAHVYRNTQTFLARQET
jgi:hypothetical protein